MANLTTANSKDWYNLKVKELMEAAGNTNEMSAFEQTVKALPDTLEIGQTPFEDYTMEDIILLIKNKRKKEQSNFSSISDAGKALILLAKNFVKVNEQVCSAYIPKIISAELYSFYYTIYHWFVSTMDGFNNYSNEACPIIDLIYNPINHDYAYDAAKYFPIINIISSLLTVLQNNKEKYEYPNAAQNALEYLYKIIAEKMYS